MYRFIRLGDVKQLTGLSRSSIYQFIAKRKFPKQLKLGERAVAWDASEVQKWMLNRLKESQATNHAKNNKQNA